MRPRLILASASPRRARILSSLGVPHRVVVTHVDESLRPGEGGAAAAERLARAKAAALREPGLPVLTADTLVLCSGRVLGKPASAEDAARMLRKLAGRRHRVVTGLCLATGARVVSGVETTSVTFARMSRSEIAWYVEKGECLDKAGAYHIDGAGALFVEKLAGSPSNVAGFPVRLFYRLLRESGISLGLPA